MKKVLLTLLIVYLFNIILFSQNPPDTLWTRSFIGPEDTDTGVNLIQSSDGNYYLLANADFRYGNQVLPDIWLLRINADGDILWTKNYGTTNSEIASSFAKTVNDDLVIVGTKTLINNKNIYVIKTNSIGDTLWTRMIDNLYEDIGTDIIITSTDEYIVLGYSDFNGNNEFFSTLTKFDSNGTLIWTQQYDFGGTNYALSLASTNDSCYAITGFNVNLSNTDAFIAKVDFYGNLLWSNFYGGNDTDVGRDIILTSDNNIVLVGNTKSYGAGNTDTWVVKTDNLGNEIWSNTFGGTLDDGGFSILETEDNGFLISGLTESFSITPAADIYLIRLNENGDSLYTKVIGFENQDIGHEIISTSDGGYSIIGRTQNLNPGSSLNYDIFMVKLSEENPLNAQFTGSPTLGYSPLLVSFFDNSVGNPISWQWDFDNDGIVDSNDQNPTWSYYSRGLYDVSLTVFDGNGEDTEFKEDFVELVNSVPIIQNPINDFSFNEDTSDSSINLNNVFDDPDLAYGDEISFSFSGNNNIQVEVTDGIVTLTPDIDWFGFENIIFTATDDQNDFVSDEVVVTIVPVNDPPILNITGTFEADEDLQSQPYDFSQYCSQTWGETDNLTLTANNSAHINVMITDFDVVFESNTNNWNGTEDITFYLNDNIAVIAENGKQRKLNYQNMNRDIVEQTVSVTINPVNDPPSIILPDDFSYNEDEFLIEDFTNFVSDVEPDDLTLSYSGNTNVFITINDLEVTFEANDDWFGSEIITFIVDDNVTELTALDSVVVNVLPVNDPPELISYLPEELNFTVIQDSVVIFEVNAEDIDSDLEYEWYVDDIIQAEIANTFEFQFVDIGTIEIKSIITDTEYEIITEWSILVEPGVATTELVPAISELVCNYPNPFNPITTIKYSLSNNSNAKIEIYNTKGQKISTLINQDQIAGYHSINWNGNDDLGNPVSSGLYLYKLIVNNQVIGIKKCLLLK
jgi:PKD repeat protein